MHYKNWHLKHLLRSLVQVLVRCGACYTVAYGIVDVLVGHGTVPEDEETNRLRENLIKMLGRGVAEVDDVCGDVETSCFVFLFLTILLFRLLQVRLTCAESINVGVL